MKRKHLIQSLISGILLLSSVLLLLTGCHGSKGLPEFSVPDTFDTEKTYEITFWAKNDTNKAQTTVYENAVSAFEALYPNIHVNLRLYTDYNKIYNDVITNIATNTTPNVCITYPDHIATYMTGENIVVPLDSLIDDEAYGLGGSALLFDTPSKEELTPAFAEECKIDGVTYALPFMRSTEVCYVNKTYVEKLGFTLPEVLTWDFVWEVSEAAMEKDADGNFLVNGQKVMIPFIYKSTDNMLISMLKQRNAGYSSADGTIALFNTETEELLKTIYPYAASGAFSTFKISGYPANFLNAGQCIFAVDSTAGSTWMGSDAPLCDIAEDKIVDFETEVMMIPQYNTEDPKMISQGPSVCLFNKTDPGEVLASWLFAEYLLTNDVQIAYAETEGYIPVTEKARNSEEYKAYLSLGGSDEKEHYDIKIKAAELLIHHTENTFVTAVFNGSASLRNAAGQLIENVTKSARRKEETDYEKLYEEVISLYRLDNLDTADYGKQSFDGYSPTAIVLMVSLSVSWLLLIIGFLYTRLKDTV